MALTSTAGREDQTRYALFSPQFVVRSDDLPSENQFCGYFFDDVDVVIGTSGASAFHKEHGLPPRDKDGIYAIYNREGEAVTISTDFSGTVPLFIYRTPGFWAVSPSFYGLMQVAHGRGDTLTAVPDVLQAWRITADIGQRPAAFQTCVKEIEVVPSYCDVVGSAASVELRPRDRHYDGSYKSALETHKRQVAGRFRTIIENDYPLVIDITGGIDSRAILASTIEGFGADEIRNLTSDGRLKVRTHPRPKEKSDREIAEQIARHFGIHLFYQNPKRLQKQKESQTFSRKERIDMWRTGQLGRNAKPTDEQETSDSAFWVSGVFGGNLKGDGLNEKSVSDGRKTLAKWRDFFDSRDLFETWCDRIISDAHEVQKHTGGPNLPFWPLWNREFLMRSHARQQLGSLRVYPLGSRALVDAVNFLDPKSLEGFKVHHDLIQSGSQALFEMPYDQEKKYKKKRLKLTTLSPSGTVTAGRMIGAPDVRPKPEVPQAPTGADEPMSPPTSPPTNSNPTSVILAARAQRLIRREDVQSILGEKFCTKAQEAFKKIRKRNGKGMRGHMVSFVHAPHLAEALLKQRVAGVGEARSGAPKGARRRRNAAKAGDRSA